MGRGAVAQGARIPKEPRVLSHGERPEKQRRLFVRARIQRMLAQPT
jgi:hypothetical protein